MSQQGREQVFTERERVSEREKAEEPPKRPSAAPKLTVHGIVEKITQVKGSGLGDINTFSAGIVDP